MRKLPIGLALLGMVLVALGTTGAVLPRGASPASAASAPFLISGGESWPRATVQKLEGDAGNSGIATFQYVNGGISGEDTARQKVAEGSDDFAVSEAPMSSSELQTAASNHLSLAYVPFGVGAVDIFSGVVGANPLNLSMAYVAGVFTNLLSRWSDIADINPNYATILNNKGPITVVTRSDSTSTNLALVGAMNADTTGAAVWNLYLQDHAQPIVDEWPTDSLGSHLSASGSEQMLTKVLNLDSSGNVTGPSTAIGYDGLGNLAAYPDAQGPAAVQNLANPRAYVLPTISSLQAAEQTATLDPTTNLYTFDYSKITATGAYPIPLVSYLIVPVSGATPAKAAALAQFVRFVLSSAGQADVVATGMAGVPQNVINAGLQVATALDAEANPTTTTTSTTTTSTTSTTVPSSTTSTTTAAAATSSTTTPTTVRAANSSSPTTVSRASTTPAAASTPTPVAFRPTLAGTASASSVVNSSAALSNTGGRPNAGVAGAGLVFVALGEIARRRMAAHSR